MTKVTSLEEVAKATVERASFQSTAETRSL